MREDINMAKIEIKELKNQSLAKEFVDDYKEANKRLYVILIVVLCMWFATILGFLYYIYTTGFEETRSQEIEDIDDLSNSNIINGDIYGKDKAN